MKINNIFTDALKPQLKAGSFISLGQLYVIEVVALIGLAVLWDSWNPVLAVLTYLIGTRSLQYLLRRHTSSRPDLIKYRTVIDGIAGLELIILGLIYMLNNIERLGGFINPGFKLDETAAGFSLVLLLVLAAALTVYVTLRVHAGLRRRRPHNPWSDSRADLLMSYYGSAKNFIIKLLKPLESFRLSSYARLSLKEKLYIGLRGLIFPIGVLVPYFLTRTEYRYCSFGGSCLESPGSGTVQNVLILAFLLVIIIVSLLRDRPRNHLAFKRFVSWQIVISVTAFVLTVIAYKLMFPYSQSAGREVVMVVGHNVTVQDRALFGTGLPGNMVFGLSVFYLLLPAVRWYRVLFSQKYIDGIKKQELFL